MKINNYTSLQKGILKTVICSAVFVCMSFAQSFAQGPYYYVGGNTSGVTTTNFTTGAIWATTPGGTGAVISVAGAAGQTFIIDGSNVGGGVAGTKVNITLTSNSVTVGQFIVRNGTHFSVVLVGGNATARILTCGLTSGSSSGDALYVGTGDTLTLGSTAISATTTSSISIPINPTAGSANTVEILGSFTLADVTGEAQTLVINQTHVNTTAENILSGTLTVSTSAAASSNFFRTYDYTQVTGTFINNSVTANTILIQGGSQMEFPITNFTLPAGIMDAGEVLLDGNGGTITFPANAVSVNVGKLTLAPTGNTFTTAGTSPTYSSGTLQYAGLLAQTVQATEWPTGGNSVTINDVGGVTLPAGLPRTIAATRKLTLQAGLFATNNVLTMTGTLGTTCATVIVVAGTISIAPIASTAYNVWYENTANITTGNELPSSSTALNQLAILQTAPNLTTTLGSNVTVNSLAFGSSTGSGNAALLLTYGTFDISHHTLTIVSGATIEVEANFNVGSLNATTSILSGTPTFAGTVNLWYGNLGNANDIYIPGGEFPANTSIIRNITLDASPGTGYAVQLPGSLTLNGTLAWGSASDDKGGILAIPAGATLTLLDSITNNTGVATINKFAGTPTSNLIITNSRNQAQALLFDNTTYPNGQNLNKLIITRTGTTTTSVTLSSALNMADSLTINLSGTTKVFTLGPALTLNKVLNFVSGTLTGTGAVGNPSSVLTISEASPGSAATFQWPNVTLATALKGLVINRQNGMTLNSSLAIGGTTVGASTGAGTLTLNNGLINVPVGDTLSISAVSAASIGGTGLGTTSWVNGILKWGFVTSTTLSRTFTIGTATKYRPVTVAFGSLTTGNYFSAKAIDGNHPQIATSNLNASYTANCYWTLGNVNISSFTNYSPTFNFNASDLSPGTAPTASTFIVNSYNGSTWTPPTTGTRTSTSTQATGLTTPASLNSSLDFQLGERNSPSASASISSSNTTICYGDTTFITGTVSVVTPTDAWAILLSDGISGVAGAGSGPFSVPVHPTSTTTYSILAFADTIGYAPVTSLAGTVTITVLAPPTFTVTGGGSYCAGGTGFHVGLNGSTTGVNYQLKLSGNNVGSPIGGNTGNSIDFGIQTAGGTYTVIATDLSTGCSKPMTGNAVIIVLQPTTSSTTVSACGSYTWNSTTFTVSGTYTFDAGANSNSAGCDSVATLVLTINHSSTSSTSITQCDSYFWNSTTYTISGTYTFDAGSHSNSGGCDSVATLVLSINHSSTSSTSVTTCGSYSWNNTTYTGSGTFTFDAGSQSNAAGCDSIATLNLTITGPCPVNYTVNFFLQGYYIGGGHMSPLLRLLGAANPGAVDTVTIELHNAGGSHALTFTYTGIVNSTGNTACTFPAGAAGGLYYVVVRHRNSIETWSASPQTINYGGSYSFTGSTAMAYGNNMVGLGGGVYGIYSGDVNQDGSINGTDKLSVQGLLSSFKIGVYNANDISGDGFVDEDDYRIMQNNVSLAVTVQHP